MDLRILKFGTWSLAIQVGRNLRRNRSDESGHRKSPKGDIDIDRVMEVTESSASRTSPQKAPTDPRDRTLLAG